jgi:hypothetical protein
MKTSAVICLLAAFSFIPSAASAAGNDSRKRLDDLIEKLSKNQIGMVEIMETPPEAQVTAAQAAEALEHKYAFKLTIRNLAASPRWDNLVKAVTAVTARPSDQMPVVRYGIVFYDAGGKRVEAIYFDKEGQGAVGDAPATLSGNLFARLKASARASFQ